MKELLVACTFQNTYRPDPLILIFKFHPPMGGLMSIVLILRLLLTHPPSISPNASLIAELPQMDVVL